MRDWEQYVRRHLSLPDLTRERESRIVREIASQLEDCYRDATARGASDADADASARGQITDWTRLAETIRHAERPHVRSHVDRWSQRLDDHARATRGRWLVIADLWQDVRYAGRQLVAQPGFTAVAVLTLALGIGANTAIFSVVNAVLLRSLPYRDADRLVAIWAHDTKAQDDHSYFSPPAVRDFREQARAFASLTGMSPRWAFNLHGDGEPERIYGFFASANVLETLGVSPLLGRGFTPDDDRPGAPPVAMVSYGLWQRRFGGDRGLVGRAVGLDDAPVTIVGILPSDVGAFDSTAREEAVEVWLPLERNPFVQRGRQMRLLSMIGRLHADATLQQAQAEISAIAARLALHYPTTDAGLGANLVPLQEEVAGRARPLLLALAGAVGLVLLIACANVASLMLGRATARHRELAIRAALGAGRWRLTRALLTESVLLAVAGGLAGLALAAWGVRALVAMAPAALPRREEIAVDGTVLLFTLGTAFVTSLLCGLAPAVRASRPNLHEALKEGCRGTVGAARHQVRSALVVVEVALALIVVTGASLLIHSFVKLQRVDPGFAVDNVVVMDLSSLGDPARSVALMEEVYGRLRALPGVIAAGETSRLPLAGVGGNPASNFIIERRPVPRGQEPPIDFRRASRDYFRAMGIPLLSGRMFEATDRAGANVLAVALINQAAAERFFPGEDPVGQRIQFNGPPWRTIVGIVGNIRHTGLVARPRPEGYIHTLQGPLTNPQLVVRTSGEASAAIADIRGAIRSVDPNVVIARVSTMESVRDASLSGPRFNTVLFGVFAALALALGLVGIYGVMAHSVAQRTREIGLRLALGAERTQVLRMVLAQGMKLAGAGAAIGLAGALGATRVLRTLLYETSPTDSLTFAAVVALVVAVALLACWVPARRAMRADPIIALRGE